LRYHSTIGAGQGMPDMNNSGQVFVQKRKYFSKSWVIQRQHFPFHTKLNHIHFFLCHTLSNQNKLPLMEKTKKFHLLICVTIKNMQSSVLAFEQRRLHQLGNSCDGKCVFVFFGWWLTHFTHQSAMHGFEV